MKKSRRKTTITWEGEVRKDSAKSLRTKHTGCSGNTLECLEENRGDVMVRKQAEDPQEEKDEEEEEKEEELNSRIRDTLGSQRIAEIVKKFSTCERKPKEHNLFTDTHCRSMLSARLTHTHIYVACIAVHLNIILRSVRWCLTQCLYLKYFNRNSKRTYSLSYACYIFRQSFISLFLRSALF